MTAMRVEVTAADIADGHRKEATTCPVARALRRQLRLLPCDVEVTGPAVTFYMTGPDGGEDGLTLDLPLAAQAFVADFDHGSTVEPFTFALDVPDELNPPLPLAPGQLAAWAW